MRGKVLIEYSFLNNLIALPICTASFRSMKLSYWRSIATRASIKDSMRRRNQGSQTRESIITSCETSQGEGGQQPA